MNEHPTKKPATGRRKVELDPRLAAYRGVWVFVEHERGATHPVSWELLGEARKLADQLGVEVAAVVLGAPGLATRRGLRGDVLLRRRRLLPDRRSGARDYRNEPYTRVSRISSTSISRRSCCSARRRSAAISAAASRPRSPPGSPPTAPN
jgi:electron transfer flavoprotein alpha subunit